MSIRTATMTLLSCTLLAVTTPVLARGDIEAGKTKSVTCQACHGADGAANVDPQYPRLAGQYRDYLERALHEYKLGKRENAIMAGFVATLTDEDMADLAAYFSSLPTSLKDLAHEN
ncbi:MAG: cytochrome c [Dokdonella sp.]